MTRAAKLIKAEGEAAYCFLPFCHTLEASGFGADINLSDGMGPRASSYVLSGGEELAGLKEWDLEGGRFKGALEACRQLKAEGEKVIFNITGPLGILNCLLPAGVVFKLLRKNGPELQGFYELCKKELLRLVEAIIAAGADGICYADPLAGVDLAGPKVAEQLARDFSLPVLKEIQALVGDRAALIACPKTGLLLEDLELAERIERDAEGEPGFVAKASEGLYLTRCTKAGLPPAGTPVFKI